MGSLGLRAVGIALGLLPFGVASAEPVVAVRGEGYLGYSEIDLFNVDIEGFQGGGVGSASLVLDGLYLQGDVFGDSEKLDVESSSADYDADDFGAALRGGWRDAEKGSLGVVGTFNRVELRLSDSGLSVDSDYDIWRAGAESELFLDRVTFALNAGFLQVDEDSTGMVDAGVSYYPIDRVKLNLRGGVVDIEEDDPTGLVGASGEWLFVDPLSAFLRWQSAILDEGDGIERHSIVVGVRLYWGAEDASLLRYDRAHFKESCADFSLASRAC